MKTPHILIANGVNLDLLGTRETDVYGAETLGDLEKYIQGKAQDLAKLAGCAGVKIEFFQTNDEAALFAKISETFDGLVLNPAAWTHTSLALADRLKALRLPYVEVHLSNIAAREEFRHHSFAAPAAQGVVFGLGFDSYLAGLWGLLSRIA